MEWNSRLAYAIGLIAADGSLSKDGRHIDFTSKDFEQIENFSNALNLKNKIGIKKIASKGIYYRVQFGNVKFYNDLLNIGFCTNKSKNMEKLKIPDMYFDDFVRGYFDGDGSTYSYYDKRWKSSFMFYLSFVSGNIKYLEWLGGEINEKYNVTGTIKPLSKSGYQLRFAKYSTIKIVNCMYRKKDKIYLSRKYSKIKRSLDIIDN